MRHFNLTAPVNGPSYEKKEKKILMIQKKSVAVALAAGLMALCACGSTKKSSDDEFVVNSNKFEFTAEMYIIGSHWNGWDPKTIKEANPSCAFTHVEGSKTKLEYTALVTAEMVASEGGVAFKFIASNSWSVQYGMEDVDLDSCNDAFKKLYEGKTHEDFKEGSSNRTNVLNGTNAAFVGSYHIVYNAIDFRSNDVGGSYKFVIDFTPAAQAA